MRRRSRGLSSEVCAARLETLLELAGRRDGFESAPCVPGTYGWRLQLVTASGELAHVSPCTLNALERRGYVRAETAETGGRFYRVTAAGEELLEQLGRRPSSSS